MKLFEIEGSIVKFLFSYIVNKENWLKERSSSTNLDKCEILEGISLLNVEKDELRCVRLTSPPNLKDI